MTQAPEAPQAAPPAAKADTAGTTWRSLALGASGVVIEWYDFAIYLYLAPVLGKLFFSAADPRTQLLASFMVYASGYLARPLGAMFYGALGDRVGRKQALVTSALLMATCKLLEGLLPTYATAGVWATVALFVLRMASGFSMGGEYAGTFVYLLENAPEGKRGATTALANLMCACGIFLSSLVVALTGLLGASTVEAWAWRVPFFVGATAGLVALAMRSQMRESPSFAELLEQQQVARSPLREVLVEHRPRVVATAALAACIAISYHLLVAFVPTYLQKQGGLSQEQALWISTGASLFLVAVMAWPGRLGDRLGRRRTLRIAAACLAAGAVPVFVGLASGARALAAVAACGGALLAALINAPAATLAVESFPARNRCAGFSLGFNLGAVAGGLAPAAAMYAIELTAWKPAPSLLLVLVAAVLWGATLLVDETAHRSLAELDRQGSAPSQLPEPTPGNSAA